MGAQAAALLDAGGAVGDVPPDAPAVGSLRLTAPPAYDLDRVARGHAGVGHPPSAYDGRRLHRVLPAGAARAGADPAGALPGGVPVVVHPDLLVALAVLDLAARELPQPGQVGRPGAPAGQHAPVAHERRSHHLDPHHGGETRRVHTPPVTTECRVAECRVTEGRVAASPVVSTQRS